MAGRHVLITGLGAVSCLGAGVPAFWSGLAAGGGRPQPVPDPDAHMPNRLMYLVASADIPAEPLRHGHVPLAAGPRMAVAAAREAVADAGLDEVDQARLDVVLGVEMGNAGMHEACRSARARGAGAGRRGTRWTPLTVTSAAVGAALGAGGSNVSVGNACAASGYAVAVAADMIRSGESDLVLTGGAEGPTRVGMGAFNRLGALDPVRCRPFGRDRQGTLFGDGAAMLVLESAESAQRRGATPYAEVAGTGWSCDAHHPTAPDPTGAQAARGIRQALTDAGRKPDEIGGVVPHATGTPLNDLVESRILHDVFGDRAARLPLLSLKAMIGHTAGAAGAFGCLATALVLRHGQLPANPAPDAQDPDCAVWLPRAGPVRPESPAVLVSSYAFGGANLSAVLTGAGGTP